MTIPTMKPSPKILPLDAKILAARCNDVEDATYADGDRAIICTKNIVHNVKQQIELAHAFGLEESLQVY